MFGGELVRQADGGQAVSVFGLLYTGIGVDAEPALSPRDAAAIVAEMTGATIGPELAPELVVLPTDTGGYVLAYRLRVLTADDLTVFFIDAATGDVALRYSDLQTTIGTGQGVHNDTKKISATVRNGTYMAIDAMRPPAIYTYDLKGNLARTQLYLNGLVTLNDTDVAADADNQWTDTAAVDAHAYAGWTYDYLYKRFNRQGLDNRNLTMTSIVHPVKREDWASVPSSVLNLYYLNAFYAGRGIMVYGEGLPPGVTMSGRQWNYFSGALDVVAHELAHGVTDYTSDSHLPQRVGGAERGVLRHHRHVGRVLLSAGGLRLSEGRLPARRGPDGAVGSVPVDGQPPGLRRPRPLLEALYRDRGQRRRPQQFGHCQ